MLYALVLILISVVSWGFVDPRSFLPRIISFHPILYFQAIYPSAWYTASIALLFTWHIWLLHKIRRGLITSKYIWQLIAGTILILIWAYPAFSNDIFNYIATSKITYYYRENPYIIMPVDLPGESSFSFLHAANKVALYGPVWIALTVLPHLLGSGNLLISIFTFKIFVIIWYLILCYLIWVLSDKKQLALAFFALNPLVVLSTVVDGHNDVVMMTLALGSLFFFKRRMLVRGWTLFMLSILIKGATVFLVHVVLWYLHAGWKGKQIPMTRVWYWSSVAMYAIFLLSPLREEMYAWYFIWPLAFLALVDKPTILHALSYGFSFGLMLRIVHFLYTRSWSGVTPMVKKIVTFVPPAISALIYYAKAFRH